MICAGWLFFGTESAIAAEPSGFVPLQQNERKEARKARRAERKARHEEYMSRTHGSSKNLERRRIEKENYKQRRQMERAARRQNRGNWGSNVNGDVFQVY